jgi:hypothetical protein
MLNSIHVIFSHGFGVFKDSRGLFDALAIHLADLHVTSTQFDYGTYDADKKELYFPAFSVQCEILKQKVEEVRKEFPHKRIIIIAHSQGSVAVALAQLEGILLFIGIAPFFHTNQNEVVARYTGDSRNILDIDGESRRYRTDGSITVIPQVYWKERFALNITDIYNQCAMRQKTLFINALQDEIIKDTKLYEIKNAFILNLDGDHDFSEKYRANLIKKVVDEIINAK